MASITISISIDANDVYPGLLGGGNFEPYTPRGYRYPGESEEVAKGEVINLSMAEHFADAVEYFKDAAYDAAEELISDPDNLPLINDDYTDLEVSILEEVVHRSGLYIWASEEQRATILADRAAQRQIREDERRKEQAKKEAFERIKPEIESLFRAGATCAEVAAKFPEINPGWLGNLVGFLRSRGVEIKSAQLGSRAKPNRCGGVA